MFVWSLYSGNCCSRSKHLVEKSFRIAQHLALGVPILPAPCWCHPPLSFDCYPILQTARKNDNKNVNDQVDQKLLASKASGLLRLSRRPRLLSSGFGVEHPQPNFSDIEQTEEIPELEQNSENIKCVSNPQQECPSVRNDQNTQIF